MATKQIRIRIGSSVDRSLENIFPSLAAAAKKARVAIEAETAAIEAALARGVKTSAQGATVAVQQFGARVPGATRPAVAAIKQFEAAMKSTEKTAKILRIHDGVRRELGEVSRRFDDLAANAEKQMARVEAAQRRSQWRKAVANAGLEQLGVRGGVGAFNAPSAINAAGMLGRGAFRLGRQVIGGLARGAGVDLDPAAAMQRSMSLESGATDLSNAGYMPGAKGVNGVRVDPGLLAAQARKVGNETAYDPNKVMQGLQAFVGKTGDLETARDTVKDLAVLSRATGTSIDDMVDAAGDVASNLGDVEHKGEKVVAVMRAVAGQGKLGAVEIKDFAVQMAKVASAASQFSGDTTKNIAVLGALAQEARQRGGAASATQAATSVQGFVNTLNTPARRAAFRNAGIKVEAADGKLRGPEAIILDALRVSTRKNGSLDTEKLKGLFANTTGARAVQGFANIYREAGGGEAGAAAVKEEFARLEAATMGATETMDSFRASMNTAEAQAQLLNNAFDAAAGDITTQLKPALIGLVPIVVAFTKSMTEFLHLGEEQHNKGDTNAELAAQGVQSELTSAQEEMRSYTPDAKGALHVNTGHVAPELKEKSAEVEAALEEAVARKKKEVRQKQDELQEGGLFGGGMGSDVYNDQRVLERAQRGDDQAAGFRTSEKELARMTAILEKLHASRNNVVEALANGTAVVRLAGPVPTGVKADRSAHVVTRPKVH